MYWYTLTPPVNALRVLAVAVHLVPGSVFPVAHTATPENYLIEHGKELF
jgi:hypothetical protein